MQPGFLRTVIGKKYLVSGFPGGAVVESLPASAGGTGSGPGLGGSHMPRSDWAREPQLLSLRVWSLCSATKEATIVRGPRIAMKSGPRLPQLEKALAQNRRPNTAIKIKKEINIKKKKSILSQVCSCQPSIQGAPVLTARNIIRFWDSLINDHLRKIGI